MRPLLGQAHVYNQSLVCCVAHLDVHDGVLGARDLLVESLEQQEAARVAGLHVVRGALLHEAQHGLTLEARLRLDVPRVVRILAPL